MFWKNKEMEQEVILLKNKLMAFQKTISQLEQENVKIKTENDSLNKQLIKYQAICREKPTEAISNFRPASSSKEAQKMFKALFKGDFYCLDDVEVDILNVFLQQIYALKSAKFRPTSEAITSCDDFFNFKKALTKREYLAMFYALLGINVTSRRFESFNSEVDKDELISMIEIIFTYIETQE